MLRCRKTRVVGSSLFEILFALQRSLSLVSLQSHRHTGACSRKPALMRFLVRDDRAKRLLASWSFSKRLLVAVSNAYQKLDGVHRTLVTWEDDMSPDCRDLLAYICPMESHELIPLLGEKWLLRLSSFRLIYRRQ
jgi:hypothetical protein